MAFEVKVASNDGDTTLGNRARKGAKERPVFLPFFQKTGDFPFEKGKKKIDSQSEAKYLKGVYKGV